MDENLYKKARDALRGVEVPARQSALAGIISASKVPPAQAKKLAEDAHEILGTWDPVHGYAELAAQVEIALFVKSLRQQPACTKAINLLTAHLHPGLSPEDWLEVDASLNCILKYLRSDERTDVFDYKCLHRLAEKSKCCLPMASRTNLLIELLKNRTREDLGGTMKVDVAVDILIGEGTPQSTQEEVHEAVHSIFSSLPIGYWAQNIRDADFCPTDGDAQDIPKRIFLRSVFHSNDPKALLIALPSRNREGPDLVLLEPQTISDISNVEELMKLARSEGKEYNVSDVDDSFIDEICTEWSEAWATSTINSNSGLPPFPYPEN